MYTLANLWDFGNHMGEIMIIKRSVCTFIGGFLAGTVGVKLLKSEPVRKAAVATVAAGMRAKASYDDIVEQARAEVEDIVAEATYETTVAGE